MLDERLYESLEFKHYKLTEKDAPSERFKPSATGTGTGTGKKIMKTWIQGAATCTLVIPKNIAAQYGLTDPSYVTVEATKEGILIKKVTL